jgi:acyl-CoA synthetase (AMP-forming)/AMP-acid ligase II
MRSEELLDIVLARPFKSHRFMFTTGETYELTHPEMMIVGRSLVTFGIPSEEWGESVHAVVVARPGAALTADALTTFARQHLAGYKMPRSVSFAREIPRTGSGKILKRVLRERDAQHSA